MSHLPYEKVRVIERRATLTGRLVGLLFADQGADMFVEREGGSACDEHDAHLDRGNGHRAADCSEDLLSAVVGIFTGMAGFGRAPGRPVIDTPQRE
jgi:hypothetical protein